MVKAVLFDMVGPLLMKCPDFVGDPVVDVAETIWKETKDVHKMVEGLRNDVTTKNLTTAEVASHVVRKFCKIPEVWEFILPRLFGRYKLAVVNNGMGITVPLFKETFNFKDYFELFINSSEEGVEKPNPGIFKITYQRLGVTPSECVFTDDSELNVKGAEDVGMKGIIYKDPQSFKEQLELLLNTEYC